jgi:uncharacterized membrane protein
MKTKIVAYISVLLPMLVFDIIWLATMAKRFYSVQLGSLMSGSASLIPAGIFYLLYGLGLTFFIVVPALNNNTDLLKVFLTGAFLGLVCYATYDLSNQATLKDWPVLVTIVDLIWGTLLTGTVSAIAVFLSRLFV